MEELTSMISRVPISGSKEKILDKARSWVFDLEKGRQ